MKFIVLACILLLTITGCKKEKIFKPQGTYTTGNNYTFSEVLMYTKSGIISDSFFIKDYLQRNSWFGTPMYFNFKRIPEATTLKGTITFEANNKVTLFDGTTIKAEITELANDRVILSEIDSVQVLYSVPSSRCEVLQDLIKQYVAVRVGSWPWQKLRRIFPLLINNEELILPEIWAQVNYSGLCVYGTGGTFNLLQPDIVSLLKDKDTVVAQMKYLPLVKQ